MGCVEVSNTKAQNRNYDFLLLDFKIRESPEEQEVCLISLV